jgi:predicted nucleotide-binding protein (sugar kinase/HSP70/actin superfamily)
MTKKITDELLKVENISLTPHLTEECRRVIIEKTIKFFSSFFDKIEQKEKVVAFAKRQVNSSRRTLSKTTEDFLTKNS